MQLKTVFIIFSGFILFGCSTRADKIEYPNYPDVQTPTVVPPVPECDPVLDVERNLSDMNNCGECGNACSFADADRCVDGHCRCGDGSPCGDGEDCKFGQCVTSDRFQVCESTEDCRYRQTCISDPLSDARHCIEVCEFDDACSAGFACVEGACTFVECVPEDCDGIDNDCDGEVDESETGTPLSRWCYSGPDIMSIMPPCQRGIQVCHASGRWSTCDGEIAPLPEVGLLGCDREDNDCDGCIDGTLDEEGLCISAVPTGFDVLFVIDQSGSMSGNIEVVRQAVQLFSTRLSVHPAFRWGIMRVPGPMDGIHELYLNLTAFADFERNLETMSVGGGGTEPQWDAIYEAATGEAINTPAGTSEPVNWRPGSTRIIILFTDEEGQTTRATRGLTAVSESEMCTAFGHGEVLVSVVDMSYQTDFDDCSYRDVLLPSYERAGSGMSCSSDGDCDTDETCEVAGCVTTAVIDMANNLDSVIADPCR
jgi:hypothetical protein